MACAAVRAKLTLVRVVLFMTGVAVCRRTLEYIVRMTLRGGDPGVSARQLEGRHVVIEFGGGPAHDGVASGAILTKLTVVRIVLLVAGEAILWRRGEVRQRERMVVALVAGNTGVPA